MSQKSIRNQVIDKAYGLLVDTYIDSCTLDHMFQEGLGNVTGEITDTIGVVTVSITAADPVMAVVARFPDPRDEDNALLCSGWSKLKGGDEWSPSDGYKICCRRVARHLASQIFSEIDGYIEELEQQAARILDTAAEVRAIYQEGGQVAENVVAASIASKGVEDVFEEILDKIMNSDDDAEQFVDELFEKMAEWNMDEWE